MEYAVLEFYTTEEFIDIVAGIAIDFGIGGVEIVEKPYNNKDIRDLERLTGQKLDHYRNHKLIMMYIPKVGDYEQLQANLKDAISKLNINDTDYFSEKVLVNGDWSEGIKQCYGVVKLGNVVIVPADEKYEAKDSENIVKIDSEFVFGTGDHATTQLCIEILQKEVKVGQTVVDIGCGSGILSLVANALGAKEIFGYETSDLAIKKALENIDLNIASNICIAKSDLASDINVKGDLIIANLVDTLILDLLDDIEKIDKESTTFICSGIVEYQTEAILNKLKKIGYTEQKVHEKNGWYAIVAKRN